MTIYITWAINRALCDHLGPVKLKDAFLLPDEGMLVVHYKCARCGREQRRSLT